MRISVFAAKGKTVVRNSLRMVRAVLSACHLSRVSRVSRGDISNLKLIRSRQASLRHSYNTNVYYHVNTYYIHDIRHFGFISVLLICIRILMYRYDYHFHELLILIIIYKSPN